MVSARLSGGQVSGLTVSSEAGGQLRVGTPWGSAAVRVTNASGATVPHSVSGGVIRVSSAAGQTYTFARA